MSDGYFELPFIVLLAVLWLWHVRDERRLKKLLKKIDAEMGEALKIHRGDQ